LSQLREKYISTGKVRFVYKQFAILGPESNRAAEASECAADQEQFWPYHDALFQDLATTRSRLTEDKLISLAGELGLDAELFSECLTSGKYSDQIIQDTLTVQSLGVRGTPGFVINGGYIAGAQPFDVFQEIIEAQLAASEGGGETTN
jgi:protein-disulfide isomerase